MDERIMQFRVGVVVLSVALLAGFLILLFGRFPASLGHKTYTIYVFFHEAPNVDVGTPIRKSGILVGRVAAIKLEDTPGKPRGVLVTAEINDGVQIWENETLVVSNSLLGDSELRVVPKTAKSDAPDPPIAPGSTIEGESGPSSAQSIADMQRQLGDVARSVTGASEQVSKLAKDLDSVLGSNDQQFRRLLNKTETSLDALTKTMTNVDSFIGDPEMRDNLHKSMIALPKALADAEQALGTLQKMSVRAEKNLQNLEGFTGPLGERGPAMIQHAERSVAQLDEVLGNLDKFSSQMNNQQGSLGRLLNDRALYDQIYDAASNVNELSQQLKPILCDARVLTDKLARHPELLGVGGAIKKSPGTK